jgi:hypothetical protein
MGLIKKWAIPIKVGNFEKGGGFYRKVVAFGEKWGYL